MKSLDDFIAPTPAVSWETRNPHLGRPPGDLLGEILAAKKWRYHHGIPQLEHRGHLYRDYVARVEALLEMLDSAITDAGVDVPASSFLDLGAAEGYVVNHLLDAGARDVDAVELAALNIERMWQIRAYKGIDSGRIGRVDLQRVNWAPALGRAYDVVLALGVIYHMENPLLFARNLFAATKKLAVVESDTPVFEDNERFRGHGIAYLHRDQVTVAPGEIRHLTELRPDRQALAEILLEAGFSTVEVVDPAIRRPSRYFTSGEKTVMVAVP